jgi:hypothetical protein
MSNIVVYTAIFGGVDDLLEPKFIPDNCDFVCFTDSTHFKSDVWDIRVVKPYYEQPVRNSRYYKTKPHIYLSDYEISIWIDGTFFINKDINDMIDRYLSDVNMACFSHNNTALDPHNCIYASAEYILYLGNKNYNKNTSPDRSIEKSYKDNPELIKPQIEKYKEEGYPQDNGLVISGVLFRRHNETDVIKVMEDWWTEIKYHSHICQLSLPYVFWKNNFKFNWIDGDIRNHSYIPHEGKHTFKTVKKGYGMVSEEYFLNMELQKGGGGKEMITNNHTLNTVRDVVEYYSNKDNLIKQQENLNPTNWQYFNCMLAEFRCGVEDHHDMGWDKLSIDYYNSKEFMTDAEIKRYLMLEPVEFGNGFIKHSYHRACAMIGRLISGKPYIPFYIEGKHLYDEIREDDGKHRVQPLVSRVKGLDKVNIPAGDFTVTQSGILSLMGIRQNDDVDIIISSNARHQLFHGNRNFIRMDDVEIFESNKPKFNIFGAHGDDDLITNYSFQIGGYNFLEPRFYFSRKNNITDRDKSDWEGIRKFFESKSHKGYPFHILSDDQWGAQCLPKM